MRLLGTLVLLPLLLVSIEGWSAAPGDEESCGVMVGAEEVETVWLPSLRVIESGKRRKPFKLPSNAPAGVRAIFCERQSLVPRVTDVKVLAAGLVLFLMADERNAVLEVARGQVQYRNLGGEFSDKEIAEIGMVIDQAQLVFNQLWQQEELSEQPLPKTAEEALSRVEELDPTDFAGMVELLTPFADQDNGDLENSLAFARMNLAIEGRRPEQIEPADIEPVIDLAQRAIAHGNAGGYNILYMINGNGFGVADDQQLAADYLRRGAAAGDRSSRLNLAISLWEGTSVIARDRDAACPLLLELGKDPDVQPITAYYLGLATYRGDCGLEADPVSGLELIEIAAGHEVRDAQRTFARSLEFGWGQSVDLRAALDWYQRAADLGDGHSLWRIGMSYVNAEYREPDARAAVGYFERSTDAENPNGMISLAVMYVTGDGVELDYQRARELYEQAAALGESHAFRELSTMYLKGEGVEVDLVRARLLYLQSVALGSEPVAAVEQVLNENMSEAQMAESDRAFTQWQQQREQP